MARGINNGYTHSETLLPLIDQSIRAAGGTVADLKGIIVANGPGSFTGIRIALSTVKALAHAKSLPVYTVSTLRALRYHGRHFNGLVCPILDARRNQVYSATYDGAAEVLLAESTYLIDQLCDQLERQLEVSGLTHVLFVGDGVAVHADYIVQRLADKAVLGKLDARNNSAAGLIDAYLEGRAERSEYDDLPVNYLRQSQAEREKGNA